MKRNQWTAIALAALLFGCGAAIGALADHYYADRVVRARTGGPEDFRQRYISETRDKVKLTPAQVTQLEQIMDETKYKVRAVRDSVRPAMLKIREDQITRVKAILTPEQIPAYEALVAERERRAKEQEERDRRDDGMRGSDGRGHHPH